MEQIIEIDGRPVKFRATAAVPRLYRIKFRRDIMQDMQVIQKSIEASRESGGVDVSSLELFENVAFIMAKHADKDAIPGTVEEWLDQFDTFSIYGVFPQLAELWGANVVTMSEAKKKSTPVPGS